MRAVMYLPGRRLLVERTASAAGAMDWSALGAVLEPVNFGPADRLSRELGPDEVSAGNEAQLPILIHLLPGAARASLLQLLAARGLSVLGSGLAGAIPRVSTLVPRAQLPALASELAGCDDVLFVERVHHLGFFNERSAGTIQAGMQGSGAAVTPIWQHGLRGENQILGLIDSGLDVDSCWFSDPSGKRPAVNTWSASGGYGTAVDASHRKVLAYDFLYSCDQFRESGCEDPTNPRIWDDFGHGTHCSGSMAGERSGDNNGMAPAAKLVVQDGGVKTNACSDMPGLGCPVIDLYPLFLQAYTQGVRIHNNSYGDNEDAPVPSQSNYSARSQDVDRFMWDHKDMLIVFAAGNSGGNDRDFSVGSPSTNKNGLSVGSLRSTPTSSSDADISAFSSRGWTADGRIKPDLMAPGCNVSAGNDSNIGSNNCATDSGCGTSYASPIAAGAAALVRQYLSDGFYPSGMKNPGDAIPQPTAASIKALLLNGASAVNGRDNAGGNISPIPSNEQGWGRIQLDRALAFAGGPRKLYLDDHRAGFGAGDTSSLSYEFKGVNAAQPFKVTLVWTDYPGMVDSPPRAPRVADPGTLNPSQLVNDLDLEVVDGADHYFGNVFANGASAPAGSADRRNNVEQVLIARPASETITLRVAAHTILQAGQDYALVVTGQWTSAGPASAPAAGSGGAGAAGSTGPSPEAAGTGAGGSPPPAAITPAGAASQPGPSGAPASNPNLGMRAFADTAAGSGVTTTPPSSHDSGCTILRVQTRPFWLHAFGLLIPALALRLRRRKRAPPRDA